MLMIFRASLFAFAALALAGCGPGTQLGSIAGGESKVFTPPPHVILGKTQKDQDWIDETIVVGVAAFNWPLPQPRPASLDNAPPPRRIVKPQKKPGIFKRIKIKLTREKPAEIAPPAVAPVIVPPPPPPRDPVDELLSPGNK